MSVHSRFWVLGCSLLAILLFLSAGCKQDRKPDDDHGPLPDFTLTERSGRSVSRADLQGKVCIAACVFTRCTGSCPQITGVMARLQHEFKDEPDVLLVSLSVDPEHDTPEVLREYADRQGARADRWLFLTGDKKQVHDLILQGLQLKVLERQGAERTPGNEVDHSNRLTLIDRRGRKRGWFDATEGARIDELLKKVSAVLKE